MHLFLLDRHNLKHVEALQALFEAAPTYHLNTGGVPASPDEGVGALQALPPGHDFRTKFVFGFGDGVGELIGCADVIRGYPEKSRAMLGLLLISEHRQAQGLGRHALQLVEEKILEWPEIEAIRIGVVETNAKVMGFWQKMGFRDTGLRRPYEQGRVHSQTILLEKPLGR